MIIFIFLFYKIYKFFLLCSFLLTIPCTRFLRVIPSAVDIGSMVILEQEGQYRIEWGEVNNTNYGHIVYEVKFKNKEVMNKRKKVFLQDYFRTFLQDYFSYFFCLWILLDQSELANENTVLGRWYPLYAITFQFEIFDLKNYLCKHTFFCFINPVPGYQGGQQFLQHIWFRALQAIPALAGV